jgi:outer membrane protein assembly factor BamB
VVALSALAMVGGLGAAPAAAAAGPWSQDGYGPSGTGYNPAETVITAATVGKLRARWSLATAEAPEGSCARQAPPVVAGGRLFVTDQVGVGAYDVRDGSRIWVHKFLDPGDTVTPLLAVAGGRLLVGWSGCASQSDPDGDLLALDAATGAQQWTVSQDAPVSTMVVDKGFVAVSGGDAAQSATTVYRVGDGGKVWERAKTAMGTGVAAAGRLLLTRTEEAGTESVEIATGAVRWKRADTLSAVAADAAGTRFFATDDTGTLWSLSAHSGRSVWWATDAAGPLATDGRRIYVSRGDKVLALAAGTGGSLWTRPAGGAAGRPVLAGGVLYVTAAGNGLTSLKPSSGGSAGFRTGLEAVGHAVVADGRLYVTDGSTLLMYRR